MWDPGAMWDPGHVGPGPCGTQAHVGLRAMWAPGGVGTPTWPIPEPKGKNWLGMAWFGLLGLAWPCFDALPLGNTWTQRQGKQDQDITQAQDPKQWK